MSFRFWHFQSRIFHGVYFLQFSIKIFHYANPRPPGTSRVTVEQKKIVKRVLTVLQFLTDIEPEGKASSVDPSARFKFWSCLWQCHTLMSQHSQHDSSLLDRYYFNLDDKKAILVQIQPCQVHGRSYQIADGSPRMGHYGRVICEVATTDTFSRKWSKYIRVSNLVKSVLELLSSFIV